MADMNYVMSIFVGLMAAVVAAVASVIVISLALNWNSPPDSLRNCTTPAHSRPEFNRNGRFKREGLHQTLKGTS